MTTTKLMRVSPTATQSAYPNDGLVPHEWAGRTVVVVKDAEMLFPAFDCELPEEQGKPAEKRNVCIIPAEFLVEIGAR